MTSAQKVIKYLAIAFAIFLIVTIVSGILSVIYALSGILRLKTKTSETSMEMSIMNIENTDIATLEIDVKSSVIKIKNGDNFLAQTNNEYIECKQNKNNLKIKEKSNNWVTNNNKEVVIYIPEDLEFEKVKINAGAGKVVIENLLAKEIDFELGAGEVTIDNLTISEKCKLRGGAGSLNINTGKINNLNLDMGVGSVKLISELTGKTKIDSGIGELKINLLGEKEDYQIKVDKGLGILKIDGTKLSNDQIYGNGQNYIEIDGGIGNITVEFLDAV